MTMWVFGYGSLVWNPGFDVAAQQIATLEGYARSFCMHSVHHRGTHDAPGLVLALDPVAGARCQGVAMAVTTGREAEVLAYLRARELISSAYVEKHLAVHLADGQQVEAVTYVIDTDHVQYCGGMDLERQAQIIARAHGGRGPNTEYLYNTAAHLAELGIADADLEWLARRVRDLAA